MAADIVVPEMGESIMDARVGKWFKKEGDAVRVGDALVELETDKVNIEVAAPSNGVLSKIAAQSGADVKIGNVLGNIADAAKGSEPASVGAAPGSGTATKPAAPAAPAAAAPKSAATPSVAATPSARQAARDKKVDLAAVPTSGNRVTKDDVLRAAAPAAADPASANAKEAATTPQESPKAAPAPRPAPVRTGDRAEIRERMSKRRATIAKRLLDVQSSAAMLTTFNEVDMGAVMELRAKQKESFAKKHGVNLGLSSFFIKATIAALREFPRLNAEIQGDEMVLKQYYDIGVAVGAAEGLVVPVIRDSDQRSFAEIEQAIRVFADKAKNGTLSIEDLRGGSFTITNGGVFGSMMSTPILNPPQVGILGLHAIKERPAGVNGQVVLRPMMYTALTYDHRIVDGSEAVRFLVKIKELIEDPGALLIES
jgi:2-oxoglutarate dehydrogenase E2 component (dihydrolipoamide succinyltransferase)